MVGRRAVVEGDGCVVDVAYVLSDVQGDTRAWKMHGSKKDSQREVNDKPLNGMVMLQWSDG
jgi:hypothetical protein